MGDKNDDFGNRIKGYERFETSRRFMPLLPIVIRLDGKGFSKFTSRMKRPYDEGMSRAMQELTEFLVGYTNARIGYTQSDEITLVLYSDSHESQVFFDGKIYKVLSVLAAVASVEFNRILREMKNPPKYTPGYMIVFDCRAFQVPSKVEAVNAVLWREKDATKNAISMAARAYYSHNELHGKSGSEMQEMLFQKGVNFNDYPAFFKRGTYVQRRRVFKELSQDVLDRIPPEHHPDGPIERWELQQIEMPPLSKIMNRNEVVFDGADPETDTEQD